MFPPGKARIIFKKAIPRGSGELVFVEYLLSLRASAHTGVAIPRMNGTR